VPQGPDLSFRKSHEAAGGATQMIEVLRNDLTKQIEGIKQQEKHAQDAYEEFLQECKQKRAIDAKAVSEKEGVKAELEASLQEDTVATKNARKKMQSTVDELSGLHKDCDWLLQYHEVRKQSRVEERDSLMKAKAVLASQVMFDALALEGGAAAGVRGMSEGSAVFQADSFEEDLLLPLLHLAPSVASTWIGPAESSFIICKCLSIS